MFFFNDTATTEIYTLSLHDALPISTVKRAVRGRTALPGLRAGARRGLRVEGLHEEGRDPQEALPLRLCHSTPEGEGGLLLLEDPERPQDRGRGVGGREGCAARPRTPGARPQRLPRGRSEDRRV